MKFTIISVVKNRLNDIKKCVDSVNSQTYENIEHIIIDGASTDGTVNFLKNQKSHNIFFISEGDNGIYDALNKGIKYSKGDIIGILHSDDVFYNDNVINDIYEIFVLNPSIDLICGTVYFVSNKSHRIIRIYNSSFFRVWMLRFGFMPAHTATFIKKASIDKIGLYSTNLKSAADFEYFVRIFYIHKLSAYFVKKPIVIMKNGGYSTSGWVSYKRSSLEILKALKMNNIYSNIFIVLMRLPFKFFYKITFLFSKLIFKRM
jgi:glycosyltransferase involved in cell wall biosynthesis